MLAASHPSTEVITWDGSGTLSACPNLTIYPPEGVREMLVTIAEGGKVEVIIDGTADRTGFKNLFYMLPAGGVYIIPDARTGTLSRYLADLLANKMTGEPFAGRDERSLADSLAGVSFDGYSCAATKAGHHVYKARDETANKVLTGKAYRHRVDILRTIPAGRLESRAVIRGNNAKLEKSRCPEVIEYPELSLRAYTRVTCAPGQVYRMGDILLPDTFRHIRAHRLSSRAIQDAAQWHAVAPATPNTLLPGTYYALDSEVPGHFGHFTSEVLARTWGWAEAKAKYPGLKALISLAPGESELAGWQLRLLEGAGISGEEIHTISSPVQVERLIGATPMFSNPKYIHRDVAATWQGIGSKLIDPKVRHAKVFASRKPQAGRGCTNSQEVEEYFRSNGFAVIYPEDLSIQEQVSLFNNADIVAGFAGSGMFSLMFTQEPKKVVIIGSESYDAINEYLFMAGAGGDLTYLWCTPRVPAKETWSLKAFLSDFTFDFGRDGKLLSDAIS
ncbi:glycosyltransferase family 61 protein [Arthrobacter sp. Z1-15]